MIPPYREPKNSPFIPHEQRNIITDRVFEGQKMLPKHLRQQKGATGFRQPGLEQVPPLPGQKPILDLQLYESAISKPKQQQRTVDPYSFIPVAAADGYYPAQWSGNLPPFLYAPPKIPIIKNYNINVSGPMDDHTKISAIFEDILPSKQFSNTWNTLGERVNIYHFVRSVFIKQGDGEDINLDGKPNSLLNYLKFMELNPYNTNQFTDNPYKGLPDDMLIYRSCYPIRYDKYSNSVQCAKNSVGLNIRIYKLNYAEYQIKKQKLTNYYDYDVWREVAYYEFIREQIIKRKLCPNFVTLYGYYICENCGIDFDKLAQIRGKYDKKSLYLQKVQVDCIVPQIRPIRGSQVDLDNYQPIKIPQTDNTIPEVFPVNIVQNGGQFPVQLMSNANATTTLELNPLAFSGRALILLTESPNYNIYSWASKTYAVEGNLRRMVNTGFHKSEVWFSVLFQLMTALFTLQINQIAFRDFHMEDNVFIKDINMHENITNYWKYKINGIDYYIPNYGYLTMVDSNFKDIEKPHFSLKTEETKDTKKFKIYSNIYEKDGGQLWDSNDLNRLCFAAFRNSFTPNVFSKSFTNYGGMKPPDDVLDMLIQISNQSINDQDYKIEKYIHDYMRRFLNNRIGTYLKETEIRNVRKDDSRLFKKGDILVQEVQNDTFKFILFIEKQVNNCAKIFTKEDANKKDIIEKIVSYDSLFNYSRYEPIVQDYKPNEVNLNEEDLLEIYDISGDVNANLLNKF